jgi:hypothetical protein
MKRKSALPPTPPADMVKGMATHDAIRALLKQIERYQSKAADLLCEENGPDHEQTAVVVTHLEALQAELLNQGLREAAMN